MANTTGLYGVREVQELLRQVDRVSSKAVTTASKKGAKLALNYAKSHCPESIDGSHGNSPGTLKRSLKIKSEKYKRGKRVYTIGPSSEGWYAHFVDYGFTDRSGIYWYGNKFLRNSVDTQRNQINDIMLNTLGEELDRLR